MGDLSTWDVGDGSQRWGLFALYYNRQGRKGWCLSRYEVVGRVANLQVAVAVDDVGLKWSIEWGYTVPDYVTLLEKVRKEGNIGRT